MLNTRTRPSSRHARCPRFRRAGLSALAIAREARALLYQSTMMHLDLAPSYPDVPLRERPVAIMLHGLFATAGAMRPLRQHIERVTGFQTAAFSYEPGCDLVTLVERLHNFLLNIPNDSVHLVGHSMGGVAVRYFVQVGASDPRIRTTTSIAGPFHGSHIACFAPAWFCRDLHPQSPALRRLLHNHHRAAHIAHTSIASTHDQLVWPWHSAIYPHGRRVIVSARGHNTMLFDSSIADHVARSLCALPVTSKSSTPTPLETNQLPVAS